MECLNVLTLRAEFGLTPSLVDEPQTIRGVVLNHAPKFVIGYLYDRIPPEHQPDFFSHVGAWRAAIDAGATLLPVNLFHGDAFEIYEPIVTSIDPRWTVRRVSIRVAQSRSRSPPIEKRTLQLSIVDRRHVGVWLGGKRERVPAAIGHRAPQPRKSRTNPRPPW